MLYELKNIRKAQKKTQQQVADELNIPISTYRNWEYLVNMPRQEDLVRLANALKCSLDELIGRDVGVSEPLPTLNPMTHTAPLYGAIAAGVPMEMWEYLRHIPLPDKFADNGKEYFYLEVRGESMNKVIHSGDYALIERVQEVNNGDITAVIINGFDATLKKWYKTENSLVLSPSSYDSAFDDMVFRDGDESNPEIQVLGKVVWWMGPLD